MPRRISVIRLLYKIEREFVVTYISMFLADLEKEQIITPAQRGQAIRFMTDQALKQLQAKKKKKRSVKDRL